MNQYFDGKSPKLPHGKLGIIALDSCDNLGGQIDGHIVKKRNDSFSDISSKYVYFDKLKDSYLLDADTVRFSNGEGKAFLKESVRGKDIYIIADVGNYNCTYEMFGQKVMKGPDEHFQDIKRIISAIGGKARRVTVIMPLLYASRQDKRKGRESLDCALALQELERLGVESIITFDAHETKVQNAIPQVSFESLHSTYGILKELIMYNEDLSINKEGMMIVSPDSGAMDRAIYYAGILGLDVGLFYKRRDYSRIVKGANPIVQHEYMGADVSGKDILVVDDMIASGGSVLDLMEQLNARGVKDIYIGVTFGFFTEGLAKFDEYYEKGLFKRVIATNLTYVPEELKKREWFQMSDMSKHLANLIHKLNYDESITSLFTATGKIRDLLTEND